MKMESVVAPAQLTDKPREMRKKRRKEWKKKKRRKAESPQKSTSQPHRVQKAVEKRGH